MMLSASGIAQPETMNARIKTNETNLINTNIKIKTGGIQYDTQRNIRHGKRERR
jgi:hypothetical protein